MRKEEVDLGGGGGGATAGGNMTTLMTTLTSRHRVAILVEPRIVMGKAHGHRE